MTNHNAQSPAAFSAWLDLFRWLAASVVVIMHAGGILMLPLTYISPAERPPAQYIYSFVAGMAHYGVMMFFVMSGYLVGGSWIRDKAAGRASFGEYMSKRVARLTIVLYPTLALTPVLTLLGLLAYRGTTGAGVYPMHTIGEAGFATIACNVAFLQDVGCQVAGGNLSLWSLTHEFWYYVCFPLLFMGWRGRATAFVLLGTLTWFQVASVPILPYFAVWLLGAALSVAPRRNINLNAAALLFLAIIVIGRVTMKDAQGLPGFLTDMSVALSFTLLLWSLKSRSELSHPPFAALHARMAGFSYTLYCTHVPLLYLFSSVSMALTGIGDRSPATGIMNWAVLFAAIGFSFVMANLISKLTEDKTAEFRAQMITWLAKPVRI